MGKQAPAPPDFKGAAQAQAKEGAASTAMANAANRPNQTNAFGSSVQWGYDDQGRMTQTQSFGGGVGQFAANAQNQLGQTAPFSFGQFGELGTGDQARQQVIDSAYGQAVSRLNPQWDQRETQMRSRLANAGLDPNSEAARAAQLQFDQGRNDAYGSAMASAIAQGQSAGDSVFRNNLSQRQQMIAEALRGRSMPMEDLRSLQALLQQQGFMGAQAAAPANLLGAAGLQSQADIDRWRATNEANADVWGGAMDLAGIGMYALSDERAKVFVERYRVELAPGVPLASWEYREGYGQTGRHFGAIAQDLEAAGFGKYVRERADGLKEVDYSFLKETARG